MSDVSLKEYFERLINDFWRTLDERQLRIEQSFRASERALDLAREEMKIRLEAMNGLHAQLKEQALESAKQFERHATVYVRNEKFDPLFDRVNVLQRSIAGTDRVAALEEKVVALDKTQAKAIGADRVSALEERVASIDKLQAKAVEASRVAAIEEKIIALINAQSKAIGYAVGAGGATAVIVGILQFLINLWMKSN